MENELTARIRSFLVILKFGHDLFEAENFNEAALLAVNNSCNLLNFKNASLVEIYNKKAHVISQFGEITANIHSRLATVQAKFCESIKLDSEPMFFNSENGLPEELQEENNTYVVYKLATPKSLGVLPFQFVWLLEYDGPFPNYLANILRLLATSIAEALHFQRLCKNTHYKIRSAIHKFWIWFLILACLIGIMFLYVPEGANAEFTLKAKDITSVYAWFDGPIARCLKQDGERVKKGDIIVQYNTSQLEYRLDIMKHSYIEIKAEYELEEKNAFLDQSRLGRAQLLEAKMQTAKVNIEEAEWYIKNSKIYAPTDGILALADGRAELLEGKVVRTGDRLFDIYGLNGMVAEIPINEKDSSVIRHNISVTLFLHTAPELPIKSEVIEIAEYPELTEQRTYCYQVRTSFPNDVLPGVRYGMRGIAKIQGERVRLGYFLFKNVVLYLRNL